MAIEDLCSKCKNLIYSECPPCYCDKGLHKDYKIITKCEGFQDDNRNRNKQN